jgi:heme oxygenase
LNKPIKSSYYLYGVAPSTWADKPYKEALEIRIKFAKNKLKEVLDEMDEVFLVNKEMYQALTKQLNDIMKAIEYNRFLLRELEGVE